MWSRIEEEGKAKSWDAVQVDRAKRDAAEKFFRGVDKDSFLAKVTKAYMAIVGDGRGGIFCANSLDQPSNWDALMQRDVPMGKFDVVLTNPPFGKNISVGGDSILSQYTFGYKWNTDKSSGQLIQSSVLHENQPPQLLFLQRCVNLLRPGGRMAIVLPEAIFGMPTYRHVAQWLDNTVTIKGVISMPEPLFKTSGKGGTHTKVCVLIAENTPPPAGQDHEIFMADVQWCGHDSRGNPTIRKNSQGEAVLLDDVPIVAQRYHALMS